MEGFKENPFESQGDEEIIDAEFSPVEGAQASKPENPPMEKVLAPSPLKKGEEYAQVVDEKFDMGAALLDPIEDTEGTLELVRDDEDLGAELTEEVKE